MTRVSSQVLDEFDRPVQNAQVYVLKVDGSQAALTLDGGASLVQPVNTDSFGSYYYNTNDSIYRREIWYGGKKRWVEQLVDSQIDANPPVPSRSSLAALTVTGNTARFLTEAGREGIFVWDSSNLSAKVTADPLQGLYVAPASAPTGVSGAWVRKFSGKADVKWWTGIPDGTTGNSTAINAALTTLNALKMSSIYGYSKGSVGLLISASPLPYRIDATIEVYHTLEIQWENGAGPSGGAAVWKVDAGVTGIRMHSNTSTGRNGETTNRGYSAVGTILRNPFLVGSFTTTEGEFYGIHMRVKTFIYDPYVEGFEGDGIFGDTSGVDNLNGFAIWNPFVIACRDGFYINYNNANAGQIFNPQMFANRRCGGVIENGYGASIYGGNSASNGQVTWAGVKTQTFNNGHVFGVLYGQETWCSTNSPPATATTNQGWKYLYDIGAAPPQAPQWVSGQTWRFGGCIRITGGSSRGVIFGHEAESGQMPIIVTAGGRMLISGGLQGPGNPITETGALYGGFIDQDGSGLYLNGVFPVADNTGAIGTPSVRWLQVNGYTIDAKTVFKVNTIQVVGARATGWTADTGTAKRTATATYAPGTNLAYSAAYVQAEQTATSTRLQLIEPALRDVTQEVKALKDDLIAHGLIGT